MAKKIVLVMDNLNTHSIASLYATFPPQHARSLAERLEIHYTPKHGSWLDIAEIELSALGRQCIADNRIPDLPSLRALLKPWATARNAAQKGVDWHFTTVDARFKLKHLYPIINIWSLQNTTLIYAHANTEQKRKTIELATSRESPAKKNPSVKVYTVSDEDTLRKLYGLK